MRKEGMQLRLTIRLFLVLLPLYASNAQQREPAPEKNVDPCGYPDTTSAIYKAAAAVNWGYGYADLEKDIARWSTHPAVAVDSVGRSVQGRILYELTITSNPSAKWRIWIHARTHPSEVEGSYVANEIISYLLTDVPLARTLRDSCIVHIVPMLNPDGVELRKPRENANNVDIESNWNTSPHQPEVTALKTRFTRLMQSAVPIHIALNVHSAYNCKRYFVYHDAGGTSQTYAKMEQRFISLVQARFPGGFEDYTYFVSWTTGTPLQYPESWFWTNHRESVLALTYEDMNCDQHGQYDRTASALLGGISDYLNISRGINLVSGSSPLSSAFAIRNHPNPFRGTTTISFTVPAFSDGKNSHAVLLRIFDFLGRELATLVQDRLPEGKYQLPYHPPASCSGPLFCLLRIGETLESAVMIKIIE